MSSGKGGITPAMKKQMKKRELAQLTELGQDVPEHLLPTPLNVQTPSGTMYPKHITVSLPTASYSKSKS